jgi:hypothetical protein
MVQINYSKVNKTNKKTTTKESKKETLEKPKQIINKYDVIFDFNHLSSLMSSENFQISVPEYLNKFFFKYGTDVFNDNGETFKLYNKKDVKNFLPSNYKEAKMLLQKMERQ